jgi:uncharacterized membrane protein YbjE (DUF340 family)
MASSSRHRSLKNAALPITGPKDSVSKGGVEIVPAAIVHGFLLSLLVPILIAFFAA